MYKVDNQEDFNNLTWQDKLGYISSNKNNDIYKTELNRVQDKLLSNPMDTGAQTWYAQINAANNGVNLDSVINNSFDKSQYAWSNPGNASNGNGISNVVGITDYLANQQMPVNTRYNNDTGEVSINGRVITPTYEQDGKAYYDKNALNNIVSDSMAQSGVQNRQDILEKYQSKYMPMSDALLDKLVNREAFTYDPENDVVYQAYKDQYTREGDRAMRDAMGNMAGLTGGFNSSAAVTAGAQANQQWQDALMARIPELAQQAYGRYADEFTRNRQALSDVNAAAADWYNREYGANSDIMNDIRYNNELNVARDDKVYDRNWTEKLYNDDREWTQKQYEDQKAINDYALSQQKITDAYNNAYMRGSFTPEEAAILSITPNADGTYPSPYDPEIQRAIRTNEEVNRPQQTWENNLERENYLWQLANTPKSYSTSGGYGGSSEGVSKEYLKSEIDSSISKWLYSTANLDGTGYFKADWNENTNPVYAARDKLNDGATYTYLKNELLGAGYTNAQANSKIKEWKENIAKQAAKIEGKSNDDPDAYKTIMRKWGWD